MSSENPRLFFAVNIPKEMKRKIGETLLSLFPKDRWRPVLEENLHITLQFLGHLPKEAVAELKEKASELESIEAFEADVNCAGHFKGRVTWLGIGKGCEEFCHLNRKLQEALGTQNPEFHAHITLARNKGAGKQEVESIVEKARQGWKPEKLRVESFELMESRLRKAGPEYRALFSVKLQKALE